MNTDQIYKAYCDQLIEIQELNEKLKKWEACADMLFVYADEVKCGTHNQALWESACQDIEKYKELKKENE